MHSGQLAVLLWLAVAAPPETEKAPTVHGIDEVRTFQSMGKAATAIAFSEDSSCLAIGDVYGRLKVWDIESGQELVKIDRYEGQRAEISALFLTRKGKRLVAGTRDACRVWEVPSGRLIARLDLRVSAIRASRDGALLLVGKDLHFLDVASASVSKTVLANGLPVDISISPSFEKLIGRWAEPNGLPVSIVGVWNLEKETLRYEGESQNLRGVIAKSFSADGTMLAVGFDSGAESPAEVEVWDTRTWKRQVRHLVHPNGRTMQTAFALQSRLICCGLECYKPGENDADGPTFEVRFVHIDKGLADIPLPTRNNIGLFEISRNGRLLATAEGDNKIRVWDLSKCKW